MRIFVFTWLIFINTYGCMSLANQISDEWLTGSDLPMLIAIPVLILTNFVTARTLQKRVR